MANPQLENGYTRIANELLEATAKARFSAAEHAVLDVVLRECYGRHGGQKECFLSFADISQKTGLPESTTSWAITSLRRRNVLVRDRRTYPPRTAIQKDYEKWKPQETVGKNATRNCGNCHKKLWPLPQEIVAIKKKKKKHLRAKKTRATDPRFQAIVNHYCQRYREKHLERDDFGGRDAKALGTFLQRHSELTLETILHRLDSAFNSTSGYPLEDRFRLWEFLDRHASYADGPRHRGGASGRGGGNGAAATTFTQEQLHSIVQERKKRETCSATA